MQKYHLIACRSTLTDPTFVKLLYDNNIIVWGGDVRDQDAWSGSYGAYSSTCIVLTCFSSDSRRKTPSYDLSLRRISCPSAPSRLQRFLIPFNRGTTPIAHHFISPSRPVHILAIQSCTNLSSISYAPSYAPTPPASHAVP
jgi:hypothetical protein